MKAASKRWIAPCAARKVVALAAVGLFLIAAETYSAWHRADLTAHASNELCKICLTLSEFTNGNVGHADVSLLPAATSSCDTPYTATRVFRPIVPQRARGPPIAS
jgi:hypothetical protein